MTPVPFHTTLFIPVVILSACLYLASSIKIKCHIYTIFFPLTRIHSPSDVLGKSLADLQKQFSEILACSQWEREEAQVRERKLQEEMALQQEKLANGQEEFRQACERALEARVRKGQEAAGGKCLADIRNFQEITVLPFSCK